ncbi:DUF3267 domain-containing protein [Barrientosiimonas marina]|uniref:DUF3267 domain-containing protein n=1 Tax=Lentibacillus kimchii TaxID=1542911 RepID=A0ABW2UUN3_9BACI
MNCWKIINLDKKFGMNRLHSQSLLIGLLTFIFLYIPLSVKHGTANLNESGIIPFILAILFLPAMHTFVHMLPLMILNKRTRLIYKRNMIFFPVTNYYTKKYLTKKASLLATAAPTLLITIPGILGSWLFSTYYVYFLIFTAAHIALSFKDILYMAYISKSPKHAYIENSSDEIVILVNRND